MLDRHMIEKRICHVKEHGDTAQDVRDLAMLLYVRDHMDDVLEAHGATEITQKMAELYNRAAGREKEIIRRAVEEMKKV